MKISEYIAKLSEIQAQHGDLEVDEEFITGRRSAQGPVVAYRRIMNNRQRRPAFWSEYGDDPASKGQKVVRVG